MSKCQGKNDVPDIMPNIKAYYKCLTHSALQTKPGTCANSVDPDETAHNEPSHQDLHCLTFRFDFWLTFLQMYLQLWTGLYGNVHFISSGRKRLTHLEPQEAFLFKVVVQQTCMIFFL